SGPLERRRHARPAPFRGRSTASSPTSSPSRARSTPSSSIAAGNCWRARTAREPWDTVSLSARAAGAYSSIAAMARLLGEPQFTMLFHQGIEENIHVATVNNEAILLAVFDHRTKVGMVRLFAKEATAAHRHGPGRGTRAAAGRRRSRSARQRRP